MVRSVCKVSLTHQEIKFLEDRATRDNISFSASIALSVQRDMAATIKPIFYSTWEDINIVGTETQQFNKIEDNRYWCKVRHIYVDENDVKRTIAWRNEQAAKGL